MAFILCACVIHMITKKKWVKDTSLKFRMLILRFHYSLWKKWDLKNDENMKGFLYMWYLLSFNMNFYNVQSEFLLHSFYINIMGNDYLYMKSDIRYKVKAYDFEYGMHFRIHLKTKLLYINCNIRPLKKDTYTTCLYFCSSRNYWSCDKC